MGKLNLKLSYFGPAVILLGIAAFVFGNQDNDSYKELLTLNREALANDVLEYQGPGTILDPDGDGIKENPGHLGQITANCDGIYRTCAYTCLYKPGGHPCGALYENKKRGGPPRNLEGSCGCGSAAKNY